MGDETKILAGIIVFWFILSTGIYFYEQDSYGDFGSSKIDMNTTVTEFDSESAEGSTGIWEVFKYIGFFIGMTTFYTPIFDNAAVTVIVNMIVYSLRLITWYLIIRLIRGGG